MAPILQHLRNLFQPSTYSRKHKYKLGPVIGCGTFGIVREATVRSPVDGVPDARYAIKIIHKKLVPPNSPLPRREIASLALLEHPNILRFVESFESRTKYYLVCEIASGGELFDRLARVGRFPEREAAALIRRVVSAIAEAHSKGIVHRDLKPENLLFRSPESLDVVVADFGVSRMVRDDDEVLFTVCGTPCYSAPEMLLSRGHGKACDMWSIGVITYILLCGYTPFGPPDRPRNMLARMFSGPLQFDERYWGHVSDAARGFVAALLQVDPAMRLTATEALQHPWICASSSSSSASSEISNSSSSNVSPAEPESEPEPTPALATVTGIVSAALDHRNHHHHHHHHLNLNLLNLNLNLNHHISPLPPPPLPGLHDDNSFSEHFSPSSKNPQQLVQKNSIRPRVNLSESIFGVKPGEPPCVADEDGDESSQEIEDTRHPSCMRHENCASFVSSESVDSIQSCPALYFATHTSPRSCYNDFI